MSYVDYLRPSGWIYTPGQTVLVVGPADGGPVMTPLEVISDPASLFGSGPLCEAVRTGLQVAPDLKWLAMRLNGVAPRVTLPPIGDALEPALVAEGVAGTANYNGLALQIAPDTLGAMGLLLPNGQRYRLADYAHLGALVEQLNRDALNGRQPLWFSTGSTDVPASALASLSGSYIVTGGSDGTGLSRDDLFFLLDDALRLVEGRPLDAVVLAGLHFDDLHAQSTYGNSTYGQAFYGNDGPGDRLTVLDTSDNMRPVSYQGLLGEWCQRQLQFGRMVMGFVPCRLIADPSLLITAQTDYVRVLVEHVSASGGGPGRETGRFIQTVAGQGIVANDQLVTLESAAAAAYLRSGIDSATNAPISAVLDWELDAVQRGRLADYGVATLFTDPRGQTRLWSGVTGAPKHLDSHWAINMRQVQLVAAATLERLDRFIGSDFRSAYLSRQIDREVQQLLNQFRQAGIVSEYTFIVEYIPLKKDVRLNLSLRPRGGLEYMAVQGQVTMA